MRINRPENSSIVYITYDKLADIDFINHGISTRCGGISEGYLGGMNLSYSRGDKKENVDENFRQIAGAIGFHTDSLVFTDQTHTTNIRVVTEEDRGKGYKREIDYKDIDGLVTNVSGMVLSVFFADCVPLLLADPKKKAIGAVHSGWRGTVGRIGAKAVERMQSEYGSNPGDIVAVIGPSICKDCYEVSADVAQEFYDEFDEKYHDRILSKGIAEGKYQLDLHMANKIILMEAGLISDNIEMPGICTCHNPEFLFSHRASKGNRGNLAAFISIKE